MIQRKVAIITGSTDGIGKATAGSLLRKGWAVVVVGRNSSRVQSTISELQAQVPGSEVKGMVADLSSMAEVVALASQFRALYARLDALVLNANAITQDYQETKDGFEANFAVGYLGRVLLCWELQGLLSATPGARVVQVVGLNLERLDVEKGIARTGFTSMKALGYWQWAAQVFTRAWNRRGGAPMGVYMPGLVRTKILANEPQPMRIFVQIANLIIGVPVEKGGEELAFVVEEMGNATLRDAYFARTKLKPARDLKDQPGDEERLWLATEKWLSKWRTELLPG